MSFWSLWVSIKPPKDALIMLNDADRTIDIINKISEKKGLSLSIESLSQNLMNIANNLITSLWETWINSVLREIHQSFDIPDYASNILFYIIYKTHERELGNFFIKYLETFDDTYARDFVTVCLDIFRVEMENCSLFGNLVLYSISSDFFIRVFSKISKVYEYTKMKLILTHPIEVNAEEICIPPIGKLPLMFKTELGIVFLPVRYYDMSLVINPEKISEYIYVPTAFTDFIEFIDSYYLCNELLTEIKECLSLHKEKDARKILDSLLSSRIYKDQIIFLKNILQKFLNVNVQFSLYYEWKKFFSLIISLLDLKANDLIISLLARKIF